MIDLKQLRSAPDQVRAALARRSDPGILDLLAELQELDGRRRVLATQLDGLKAQRNEYAKADAQLVKQHGKLPAEIAEQRRRHGLQIATLEAELRNIETVLEAKALFVPNLPLADVPTGDASAAPVVRTWGTPAPAGGTPHWEIAERLGILDLKRGAKLSGSGFPVFVGAGARLVRGLLGFMLDLHTREHGYVECAPPFLVRREDLKRMPRRAVIIDVAIDQGGCVETSKPTTHSQPTYIVEEVVHYWREAGAAGKDTRGLLRVHQFDKVELVRFCRPQESGAEHEKLVGHAEEVLRRLELPYRVVLIPAGELGFANAKQYDLEVWAPAVGAWLEVSSASVYTDYQARRANIRFRPAPGAKPEFVHTLNASGVALPRTIAALLETRQQPDGSVSVPPALVPYLGTDRLTPAGAS